MANDNKGVSLFVKRCNDLVEGKYLLAEKNISNLLKSIAQTEQFTDAVSECLSGFDFKGEYEKCKIERNLAGDNKALFILPADEKKFIGYTICLLWQFDNKAINFNDYLAECYVSTQSLSESYAVFAELIIKRFKNSMLSLVNVLGASEECLENNAVLEKFFVGQTAEFGMFVVDDTVGVINTVTESIANDAKLRLDKKQEMIIMCDGFASSIITKDKKLIKLMWIGFKNTVGFFDKIGYELVMIEKVLRKYNII